MRAARAREPASSSAASAARALSRLWRPGTGRSSARARAVRVEGQDPLLAGQAVEAPIAGQRQAPRPARRTPRKASSSWAREDQREWWSSSTLVTTATSGRRRRKLASDSSASAITHSPSPQPALPGPPSSPAPGSSPPSRKPGPRPLPAGRGRACPRSSSCRASRRSRAGAWWRRARPAARRDGSPAGRARGPRPARGCPRERRSRPPPRHRAARRRRRDQPAARCRPPAGARGTSSARSEPVTRAPSRWQTSARPLIPAPPMAMKCSLRPLQSVIAALVTAPPPAGPRAASTCSARSAASGRARARRPRTSSPGDGVREQVRHRSSRVPRSSSESSITSAAPASDIQAALALDGRAVACGIGTRIAGRPRPRARTPSRPRGRAPGRRRQAGRRASARTRAACSARPRRRRSAAAGPAGSRGGRRSG